MIIICFITAFLKSTRDNFYLRTFGSYITLLGQTVLERFSVEFRTTKTKPIGHFTVVCSVTWPLNASEAGVKLALLRTSLLFHSNTS